VSISDKTRKVLWGRSGNRCAICKNELVIDATQEADESIVADECHIISSRTKGPRYDPSYASAKFDSYDNLILLCRTHHKIVDDQAATFTTDILRQMKANHEVWVSQQLAGNKQVPPVRIRRVRENIPPFLSRLTTGKDILDVVGNTMVLDFDHDELKSQEEVDIVCGFMEAVEDWGEVGPDFEARERIQMAYHVTEAFQQLEPAGFAVFGRREVRFLEVGVLPQREKWPVAILRVMRVDNPAIMRLDSREVDEQEGQRP
jgi:hypothetical protein